MSHCALSLEVETRKHEVIQKVRALEQLIRTGIQVRYELFELREALAQALENERATLAQGDRIAFRRGVAATTQQEQVTKDDCNNWSPHPSPDGKWLVFLSYEPSVQGGSPKTRM